MISAQTSFKDTDGCVLVVDSYVAATKRGATDDYAFVVMAEDGRYGRTALVGLTFEQAKNLAVFLVEELAK